MKECIVCEKKYKGNSNAQKCCSKGCFNKHRKEYIKKLYKNNKENNIKRVRNNQIKTNYKYEKTQYQRKIRNIKRKTRYYFPLKGQKCEICRARATEHHHYTKPIRFDKFKYMCHRCHNETK